MNRRRARSLALAFAAAAGALAWFLAAPRGDDVPLPTYAGDGRLLRGVSPPWQPPNLVVLVVDTLRADAVDPDAGTGAPGPTSMPFVARLAREGSWFRQASAPAPWTMPSLGSLLTGLLPARHGSLDSRRPPSLPRAVPTYAELLQNAYGYETAAFVDTPWLGGRDAFGQGFAHYQEGFGLGGGHLWVDGWLQGRDSSRPFFLLLHATDVHDPYGPENHPWPQVPRSPDLALADADYDEPWEAARAFLLDRPVREVLRRRRGDEFRDTVIRYLNDGFAAEPRPALAQELRDAYYRGARAADAGIERVFEALRARGALDNTLFVVTADHGEAFGEHGLLGHGRRLYDEVLRIPLVAWGPPPFRGGKVVDEAVGLVDVLPTFLDLAGVPDLDGGDGRSFLKVAAGDADGWPVLAQEILNQENARVAGDVFLGSARSPQWKYVVAYDLAAGTVREEVYDLLLDPREKTNLLESDPGSVALDAPFCEAIERVRDAVWGTVREREGDPRGAAGPVGLAAPRRPEPCRFR